MIVFSVFSAVRDQNPNSGGSKLAYYFFKFLKEKKRDTCIYFVSKGNLKEDSVFDLGKLYYNFHHLLGFISRYIPLHLSLFLQQKLFDYFLFFHTPKNIKILVTYAIIPYTARKLKKKNVQVIFLSGNANDIFIYEIVKKEKQKYNITEKDPYDYLPRIRMYKSFINYVDKIICINEYIYNSYDNFVEKQKRILLPTIFDANYDVFDTEKQNFDDFNLFYCGHTSILKGLHNLIDSFNKFKIGKTNVWLYIGGSINFSISKLIENKDMSRIIFLGYLTSAEIANILSKSTLFIIPSLTDAAPVAMIEAMFSKTPVISSDGVGNNWIIKEGYNGFTYNCNSIGQLTDHLTNIFLDRSILNKIGENSRNTIFDILKDKENFYANFLKEIDK